MERVYFSTTRPEHFSDIGREHQFPSKYRRIGHQNKFSFKIYNITTRETPVRMQTRTTPVTSVMRC